VQNAENRIFKGIFYLRKVRGLGPRAVDHVRPRSTVDRPWTVAPSSLELRPPAVPVSKGTGQGAGEEEWNAGSSVGGSPGRGRQCGNRASRRRSGGQWGAQWGGALTRERRRGELGEGRDVPWVLGGGGGALEHTDISLSFPYVPWQS
jgi:hypothetical protein